MKIVDTDVVIPKLAAMAEASEKSIQGNFSDDVGSEIAREAMKAIAGTLRAVIKVLTDQDSIDVVPIEKMAEFLAGYCQPPNAYEWAKEGNGFPGVKERKALWTSFIRELMAYKTNPNR